MTATWVALIARSRIISNRQYIPCSLYQTCLVRDSVLTFFQMTKVMEMIDWKYFRLNGSTKTDERAGFVKQFNAQDSEINVFILSTRAGGLSLNLRTVDMVIM